MGNQKLEDCNLDDLANITKIALSGNDEKTQGLIQSKEKGHIIGVMMIVHGYDGDGESSTIKYGEKDLKTRDMRVASISDMKYQFSGGIRAVYFAYRYGTGGLLKQLIDSHLTPMINGYVDGVRCVNPYKNKYDELMSHITIARLSKQKDAAKKITQNTPRLLGDEINVIMDTFNKMKAEFSHFIGDVTYDGQIPFLRVSLYGFSAQAALDKSVEVISLSQ